MPTIELNGHAYAVDEDGFLEDPTVWNDQVAVDLATTEGVAALGENLILLVNLAWAAWLALGFLRRRRTLGATERWQTSYVPVYLWWTAVVVALFPPILSFA